MNEEKFAKGVCKCCGQGRIISTPAGTQEDADTMATME